MMMMKMKLALSFLLFVSAHAGVEDSVSADSDRPSFASVVVFVERLTDYVSFPMECIMRMDP